MSGEDVQSKNFVVDTDELVADIDSKLAEELRNIQAELLNLSTKLVFEVATCECNDKENCGIYSISKEIAKVMKELQNKAMVTVKAGGKTREVKKHK